jgi:hypothetical protein
MPWNYYANTEISKDARQCVSTFLSHGIAFLRQCVTTVMPHGRRTAVRLYVPTPGRCVSVKTHSSASLIPRLQLYYIDYERKISFAFSGGLDTSFCVKYLTEEKGFEVYTAIANTGGFTEADLARIEEKAYRLGAKEHVSIDITEEYYNKCIRYMVFGNVLRNNTYPISVSSERVFQAIATIEYAKKIGAKYVAHGSTGAGNDQVRFDLTYEVLSLESTS